MEFADSDFSADLVDNWQDIVDLLAEVISVPSALVMRFVDPDIEVFRSSNSSGNPYTPGDHEELIGSGLYCETVIRSRNKLLVPNALADPDWRDNPDVKLDMISYLGYPILLPDQTPFGTLCVLDSKPNEYNAAFEGLMMKLRNLIESHLALLYMNKTLGDQNVELLDYLRELQAFRGIVPICSNCKSIRDRDDNWQPIENYLVTHPDAEFSHSLCPDCLKELYG